jgi:hypothetical protein
LDSAWHPRNAYPWANDQRLLLTGDKACCIAAGCFGKFNPFIFTPCLDIVLEHLVKLCTTAQFHVEAETPEISGILIFSGIFCWLFVQFVRREPYWDARIGYLIACRQTDPHPLQVGVCS